MPSELPKELWMDILKRMKTMQDWGRLQQVSRPFYAIIQAECWTQAKHMMLTIREGRVWSLEVTGQSRLELSESKTSQLVEELAEKATKIQAVSLEIHDDPRPQSPGGVVLQRLASASLSVKQLHIDMFDPGRMSIAVPLADFIRSISGSLESLHCGVHGIFNPITAPDLHEAFRSCQALQTIGMDVRDYAMIRSVLYGKTKLQTLRIIGWGGGRTPLPVSALLNTGAHLTSCRFEEEGLPAFQEYTWAVQQQNLIADHPLKTLKTLTFDKDMGSFGDPMPFHLFPNLEEVVLPDYPALDFGILNTMVGSFLAQFQDAPGNRHFLHFTMIDDNYRLPPLARILKRMTNPVASAERMGWGLYELTFVRGNAIANVTITRE